jgi:hypothetical protein
MSSTLRLASLQPLARAVFATNARLLSGLVTESLVAAQYFSLEGLEATGVCIIYCQESIPTLPDPNYVLAAIPLLQVPVLKSGGPPHGVVLLDPSDMLPLVFEVEQRKSGEHPAENSRLSHSILKILGLEATAALKVSSSPLSIWEKYATSFLKPDIVADIGDEFSSAVEWQSMSYLFDIISHAS